MQLAAAASPPTQTTMKVGSIVGAVFALYLLMVVVDLAFVATHSIQHAETRREAARQNAILCERNPSLMYGPHGVLCQHDMADQHMSVYALALADISREATLCPNACASIFSMLASFINGMGFIAAAAVGGAFVFAVIGLRMLPATREKRQYYEIEDGGDGRIGARIYQLPSTDTLRRRSRSGSQ